MLNFNKAPRWAVSLFLLALVIFTVGFTANPPENAPSGNFSVTRLGAFPLEKDDVIKSDVSWSNGGTIVALYTDKDYTDGEILNVLQGIPGIPGTDKNFDPVDGAFNFMSSGVSPLTQEQSVTKTGTYHFYIVHGGFAEMAPMDGSIIRIGADGDSHEIWSGTTSDESSNRAEILAKNFEKYAPFGVIYDAEQDAVFFNGERVKLFVDFKKDKDFNVNYAFELCYCDSDSDGNLYLEVSEDGDGNIIGVNPLDVDVANEILDGMASE